MECSYYEISFSETQMNIIQYKRWVISFNEKATLDTNSKRHIIMLVPTNILFMKIKKCQRYLK